MNAFILLVVSLAVVLAIDSCTVDYPYPDYRRQCCSNGTTVLFNGRPVAFDSSRTCSVDVEDPDVEISNVFGVVVLLLSIVTTAMYICRKRLVRRFRLVRENIRNRARG